jgi:hypothetical protein
MEQEKSQMSPSKSSKPSNKHFMNFIDFYRHQYAYSPSPHEPLFTTNKLTTPKENIKKLKVHVSISLIVSAKGQRRTD